MSRWEPGWLHRPGWRAAAAARSECLCVASCGCAGSLPSQSKRRTSHSKRLGPHPAWPGIWSPRASGSHCPCFSLHLCRLSHRCPFPACPSGTSFCGWWGCCAAWKKSCRSHIWRGAPPSGSSRGLWAPPCWSTSKCTWSTGWAGWAGVLASVAAEQSCWHTGSRSARSGRSSRCCAWSCCETSGCPSWRSGSHKARTCMASRRSESGCASSGPSWFWTLRRTAGTGKVHRLGNKWKDKNNDCQCSPEKKASSNSWWQLLTTHQCASGGERWAGWSCGWRKGRSGIWTAARRSGCVGASSDCCCPPLRRDSVCTCAVSPPCASGCARWACPGDWSACGTAHTRRASHLENNPVSVSDSVALKLQDTTQLDLPVWVLRCLSMSFWPYCVLKVQPADRPKKKVLLQGVCKPHVLAERQF